MSDIGCVEWIHVWCQLMDKEWNTFLVLCQSRQVSSDLPERISFCQDSSGVDACFLVQFGSPAPKFVSRLV